jgi:phosphatidylglycerophosphate synthase
MNGCIFAILVIAGTDPGLTAVAVFLLLAMIASFACFGFIWLWVVRESSKRPAARIGARLAGLGGAAIGVALVPLSLHLQQPSSRDVGVFGILLAVAGLVLCFGNLFGKSGR